MKEATGLLARLQEAERTGRKICFQKEYLLRSVYHRYVDTYVWCRRFCEHYDLCKLEGEDEVEVVETDSE